MATKMQHELLVMAKQKPITLLLAMSVYSSRNSAQDALTHLTQRGYLKVDYGVYHLTKEGEKELGEKK